MSPLPLLKIGSLLVKTIAKPVAKRIKESAHNHPRVRNLCIGLGRVIHYATTHMEVNLRQGKVISLKQLPDTKALTTGADFLGELFVFAVGTGMIFVEFKRQRRDKQIEKVEKARRSEAKHKIISMRFKAIEQELHHLARHIAAIEHGMRQQGYEIPLPTPQKSSWENSDEVEGQMGEESELIDKYDKMIQSEREKLSTMRERLSSILQYPLRAFNASKTMEEGKDSAPPVEIVDTPARQENEDR